jgi:hypothetical protein
MNTLDTPAKNINNPPSPPTLLPGWIMLGTDLATAKSANQFAAVEIAAPLARRNRGYVSGGYSQALSIKVKYRLDQSKLLSGLGYCK